MKFDGHLKFDEEDKRARQGPPKRRQRRKKQQQKLADTSAQADGDEEADSRLPELTDGEALRLEKLDPQQKFTQPPPRYNEASLVKTLEEKGIGRPSTYASIINTIQDRDYVKKDPVEVCPDGDWHRRHKAAGEKLPVHLRHPPYTATLEGELDAVEEGHEKWTDLLNGFYGHFEKELSVAGKNMEDIKRMEQPTTEVCDNCGAPLILKWGQVRQLLLLQQLHQGQADNDCGRPWKKDPKAVTKKVTKAFAFPLIVKSTTEDVIEYSKEVGDAKEMAAAHPPRQPSRARR